MAACVDPLALAELAPLAALLAAPALVKVMHASRQDLEVLLPLWPGWRARCSTRRSPPALTGLPAQVGYAELVRRLLGHELAKAHTRTDWSRRPLSPEQIEYALDDVRYLLPLAAHAGGAARAPRAASGGSPRNCAASMSRAASTPIPRRPGSASRDAAASIPAASGSRARSPPGASGSAIEHNRPRGWILEDAGAARDRPAGAAHGRRSWQAIAELPAGLVRHRGAELLACVAAAGVPDPPPPAPGTCTRPDPARNALVKKLGAINQTVAAELSLVPEVLATRRDLEQLAEGRRDGAVLRGWRRSVLGERLLAAL